MPSEKISKEKYNMKKLIITVFILLTGFNLTLFAVDNSDLVDSDLVNSDTKIITDFLWEEFISLPADERPKIGVVLSAGGIRGFAHAGLMEVLIREDFPIDVITGTSMGAVIGGIISAGISLDKVWETAEEFSLEDISRDFNKIGFLRLILGDKLFSSESFETYLENLIGNRNFEELNITFGCAAMDINTGEEIVFTSGKLLPALRASMNMPGFFKPVEYRHRRLVDGGIVDYLPVGIAKKLGADWVIASITAPDYTLSEPKNTLAFLMQSLDIRGALLISESEKKADYVIRFDEIGDVETLDVDQILRAGEVGVRNSYKHVDNMKKELILSNFVSVFEKDLK